MLTNADKRAIRVLVAETLAEAASPKGETVAKAPLASEEEAEDEGFPCAEPGCHGRIRFIAALSKAGEPYCMGRCDGHRPFTSRSGGKTTEYRVKCRGQEPQCPIPDCGGPMRTRWSRDGSSKYLRCAVPGCPGTRFVPEETWDKYVALAREHGLPSYERVYTGPDEYHSPDPGGLLTVAELRDRKKERAKAPKAEAPKAEAPKAEAKATTVEDLVAEVSDLRNMLAAMRGEQAPAKAPTKGAKATVKAPKKGAKATVGAAEAPFKATRK